MAKVSNDGFTHANWSEQRGGDGAVSAIAPDAQNKLPSVLRWLPALVFMSHQNGVRLLNYNSRIWAIQLHMRHAFGFAINRRSRIKKYNKNYALHLKHKAVIFVTKR